MTSTSAPRNLAKTAKPQGIDPLLYPAIAETTRSCNHEETNPTSSPTSSNGNIALQTLPAAIDEAGPRLSEHERQRILAIVEEAAGGSDHPWPGRRKPESEAVTTPPGSMP